MSSGYGYTTENDYTGVERRKFSKRQKIGLEMGGFLAAEFVSAGVGVGVVAVADMIIPKPILKGASKCLATCVIEPFLEPIERSLSKVCKLEECQVDPTKSRAERAEQLAKTAIVFGAAWAVALEAKLFTRHKINDHFGIHSGVSRKPPANSTTWETIKHYGKLRHWTNEDKVIFAVDEGMHLGALYLLNNTLAPFTDRMIKNTTGTIERTTGWSHEKSHQVASMAWIWEAANALGAVAGIGIIAGNHSFGLSSKIAKLVSPHSHVDKLRHDTALSSVPTGPHRP